MCGMMRSDILPSSKSDILPLSKIVGYEREIFRRKNSYFAILPADVKRIIWNYLFYWHNKQRAQNGELDAGMVLSSTKTQELEDLLKTPAYVDLNCRNLDGDTVLISIIKLTPVEEERTDDSLREDPLREKAVRLLLELGANVNSVSASGCVPLYVAIHSGNSEFEISDEASVIGNMVIIRLLLGQGADVAFAMYCAAKQRYGDIVRWLNRFAGVGKTFIDDALFLASKDSEIDAQ